MKIPFIILTIIIVTLPGYSQELETLGAGVIKFLLTNPKTASQNNATDVAALNVIGSLLDISAQRKHEMNVASAGRTQIVYNTTGGGQATVYSDNQGNIYFLYDGTIYPISKGFADQARGTSVSKEIENSTLNEYNIELLKSKYRFDSIRLSNQEFEYFLQDKQESISEIASKFNITQDGVYLARIKKIDRKSKYADAAGIVYKVTLIERDGRKYGHFKFNSQMKEFGATFTRIDHGQYKGYCTGYIDDSEFLAIHISVPQYQVIHEIVCLFTFNWVKDFDGKGYDFHDFQGVKRSFIKGERMMFAFGYTTEIPGTWSLEVYDATTGDVEYKKTGTTTKGGNVVTTELDIQLKPGVYMYNYTLTTEGKDNILKSEKFEIIAKED